MEEWRNVPGFNGKYQIDISTKEGRCRSLNYNKTGKQKIFSNKPQGDRIFWILSSNGKSKCMQAARWIALTYPELVQNEYFEGAEIDHIDRNPMNNHPSNLRWVTHKDNLNNPLTKQIMSISHKGNNNRPDQSKPINQYTADGDFITSYPSLGEAYRQTGIDKSNIYKCCNGKRNYAGMKGGEQFVWKYKE